MAQSTIPQLDIPALPWWSVEVFRARGEGYTWQDVLMSARLRGEWDIVDAAAREGVSCAAEAAVSGTGSERARVDDAAREFRYAHDLITADSAERWLGRWGFGVEHWMAHFTRVILRREWADRAAELVARHSVSQAAVAAAALVDAICGGHLRRLARLLADHVAAPVPPTGVPEAGHETAALIATAADAARADRWPAMAPARMTALVDVDRRYRAYGSHTVTPASLAEHVGTRQLDWTRFECRALAFRSADGASEAALCLREDGLPLAELARRASTVVQDSTFFLEELDAAVHDRFVGARTGDLIGPVRQNGEYVLYEIVGKTLPSPSDPIVLVRAQEGVLKRAIAHQVANHVQWTAEP